MNIRTGTEWIVDATGCDPARLADLATLQALFEALVADLRLTPAAEAQWTKFPGPGGVTGLLMLRESHLACHTFPEHGVAAVNLYCCTPRERWPWEGRLAALLGATRVEVREVPRGGARG